LFDKAGLSSGNARASKTGKSAWRKPACCKRRRD
jgi:hypothetical protein